MPGYFGTEMQQRLQAQAEANADFIAATPGACQTGRTMGCDDPTRLGWDQIDQFLERDGVCGFRLIPSESVGDLKSRLMERGYKFDTWDVFVAERQYAFASSMAIVSRGLFDGLIDLHKPSDPESAYTASIQALMNAAGVVPFSGSLLTGACGPATTVAVGDGRTVIAATAHGYMPHNTHSAHRCYAWGGLVAVGQAYRGKGLGTYINARMIEAVFRDLDATHIYELVSATNLPSRRMFEACGLRQDPALTCGVATPKESARFTR